MQNGAAAIAMDPSTGAILGMVSLGNFDLNNYQKVSDKDQEAIDAETDPDKRSELLTAAQQKQWRNKALSDTYEPGSTFKIITLALSLIHISPPPAHRSRRCGSPENCAWRDAAFRAAPRPA